MKIVADVSIDRLSTRRADSMMPELFMPLDKPTTLSKGTILPQLAFVAVDTMVRVGALILEPERARHSLDEDSELLHLFWSEIVVMTPFATGITVPAKQIISMTWTRLQLGYASGNSLLLLVPRRQ